MPQQTPPSALVQKSKAPPVVEVPPPAVAKHKQPEVVKPIAEKPAAPATAAEPVQPKAQEKTSAAPKLEQRNGSWSARPGVARFLGRRNTAGNIVPLTQTEVQLPGIPWIRPALTVGLAAIASFLVVAAILWITSPRQTKSKADAAPPSKGIAMPTVLPTKTAAAIQPVAPPPPPSAKQPPEPLPIERAITRPQRTKARGTRRSKPSDPDAPLPPTFF
jgi:hypothetical protein